MSNNVTHSIPPQILVVDDNMDDAQLTREGFRRTRRQVDLHFAADGEQCLRFLRKTGEYTDVPTPDLVLLDLNMPVMDGREVLAELGKDDSLKQVPVVVLTTSNSSLDVMVAYNLRCNSYVVKPLDFHDFQQVVNGIYSYWFETVTLPTKR